MSKMSNASRQSINGTKHKTRKDKCVWSIGHTSKKTVWKKAPSAKEVLSVFVYLHKIEKVAIKGSSKKLINMCIPFWEKAKIIAWTKMHARKRVEKLFLRWKKL